MEVERTIKEMSEQRSQPAIEDFDFIRKRLEQLKKEQEDAIKQSSNAPQVAETNTFDYCVPVGSDMDYCVGFNELSTGPRAIHRYKTPEEYKQLLEIAFENYHVDENDEIISDEKTIAQLYGLELNFK